MQNKQEEVVSKFGALLGTNKTLGVVASSPTDSDSSASARTKELMHCLSRQVASHEVICTMPSLDIRKADDEALPKVGEHRQNVSSDNQNNSGGDKSMPQMEASVLSNAAHASAKAAQLEQKAAQSLGSLTSWTKSSVTYASTAISKNVSDSFSSLVDSRVRAWTLLLLRHSLTTGDAASRSRLLSMLSSIIKVESAKTAFKTLPLPESAVGQPKETDVILPLLLEVDMQVSIQNKRDIITLRAPGTISGKFVASREPKVLAESFLAQGHSRYASYNLLQGNFDKPGVNGEPSSRLIKVEILLDTGALLDSMVQQARMVVFKAVAKATAANDAAPPEMKNDMGKLHLGPAPSAAAPAATLSGFSSALNLSSVAPPAGPYQPSHKLQKARCSALRLNSVLEGGKSGGSSLEKTRKSRSVQWDRPMDIPKMKSPALPSPKRQRVAQTSARMASFKSFGRPHGGDFGSGPRNATFGDFGRKPMWGRDGKLANHPSPMQENQDQDMLSSAPEETSKNATFDFQRPSIHLSSGLGLDLGSTTGRQRNSMNRVPSSIPRTATALEGWLMKSTNT
jgi:hypothetical protein